MPLLSEHGLVPEKDAAKVTTHSTNLYAKRTEWPRQISLKVLSLLGMAFDHEPDDNQNFLEIGCGPGDFTKEYLLPSCPPCRKIVAGDVSKDMLEYAKEHFSHPKIVHDFLNIEEDVSQFVAKHGQFRRIYSFFCLHWMKDLAGSLRNISKLMSPDGECLVVFIARHPYYPLRRELVSMERWEMYRKVVEDVIPKTQDQTGRQALKSFMLDLLDQAGLEPQTFEVLRMAPVPLRLDAFIDGDLATNPVLPLLSEEDKLLFAEDVNRLYRSRMREGEMHVDPWSLKEFVVFHALKRI